MTDESAERARKAIVDVIYNHEALFFGNRFTLADKILAALRAEQPAPEKGETDAGRVWSAFVEACESIENEALAELAKDNLTEHEIGFRKGMKFSAKSIRRSVEHPKYAARQPSPADAGPEKVETPFRVNGQLMSNVGHGHVFPRPDGIRARCGGPGMCKECSQDLARKNAVERQPSPADDAGSGEDATDKATIQKEWKKMSGAVQWSMYWFQTCLARRLRAELSAALQRAAQAEEALANALPILEAHNSAEHMMDGFDGIDPVTNTPFGRTTTQPSDALIAEVRSILDVRAAALARGE